MDKYYSKLMPIPDQKTQKELSEIIKKIDNDENIESITRTVILDISKYKLTDQDRRQAEFMVKLFYSNEEGESCR